MSTKKDLALSNVPAIKAETLIAQAIQQNVPVETMERLLIMRKDLKAEFAKEEFVKAMAKFQGECPVIKKAKAGGTTKSGIVAYYYAPLEDIVAQTKELIQKNGFSYMIQSSTSKEGVKVTCTARHQAGHSESSDIEIPFGTKTDIMSASQVVAAALTFAKRYAFCNVFGILTGDADTDGKAGKQLPPAPKTPQTSTQGVKAPIGKPAGADSPAKEKLFALAREYGANPKFETKVIESALKIKINWARCTEENLKAIYSKYLAKVVK